MKWRRALVIAAMAFCATIVLTACGSTSDSTAPAPALSNPAKPAPSPTGIPTSIFALSPQSQPGWAGFSINYGPTIKVLDQNGIPVSNLDVNFAVTRGDGRVSNAVTTTNGSGRASTEWVLGPAAGTNTVVASVAGTSGTITFSAEAKAAVIVARYDLIRIADSPLPVSYTTGDAPLVVTGGHYLITADNTFAFGYEINGIGRVVPTGTIVRVDPTTIQFILSPGSYPASQFYQSRDGLFATGRIDGDIMTVTYEDFVDFDIEKYVLSNH